MFSRTVFGVIKFCSQLTFVTRTEKGRGELRINRIQINITITKLQRVPLSNRYKRADNEADTTV